VQYPDSNVGLVTGVRSGLVGVDIDPRNGGAVWWKDNKARLIEAGGYVEQTGGGGLHIWFRHPGGWLKSCTGQAGLAPGVELKADGGHQVVVTPSIHESGKPYQWHCSKLSPDATPAQGFIQARSEAGELPGWIAVAEAAPTEAAQPSGPTDYPDQPTDIARCMQAFLELPGAVESEGGDTATFKAALIGRDMGLSPETFWPIFRAWNSRCRPRWEEAELHQKMLNAYRYAKGEVGGASPADFEPVETAAEAAARPLEQVKVARGDTLIPEEIAWLWPGWIPQGELTIFAGPPGLGKSTLTQDLAARVTNGTTWPDGAPGDGPGDVILLNAEDHPTKVLAPRLIAAGADMSRIYLIQGYSDSEGKMVSLSLDNVHPLEMLLPQVPRPRLIIVDPVMAFVASKKTDDNRASETREMLHALLQLATKWNVALLFVAHFNKRSAGTDARSMLERIMGSMAYGAACRSAFCLLEDKEAELEDTCQSAARLVLHGKANLGKVQAGFHAEIEEVPGTKYTRIAWGERLACRVEEALAGKATQDGAARVKKEEVANFLRRILKDEPRKAQVVFDNAKELGYNVSMTRRVFVALGGTFVRDVGGVFLWRLPATPVSLPSEKKDEWA